jgi:hypothetical protein
MVALFGQARISVVLEGRDHGFVAEHHGNLAPAPRGLSVFATRGHAIANSLLLQYSTDAARDACYRTTIAWLIGTRW